MSTRIRKEQRVRFYWLLLGILGVWRITHLLHVEDGPWKLLAKLRALLGRTLLGQLFDCFYCLSLWIAAPFAWLMGEGWKERLLLWPALSGAAVLLERVSAGDQAPPPAIYFEDQEKQEKEENNVLR
jgi:hypothetical protein